MKYLFDNKLQLNVQVYSNVETDTYRFIFTVLKGPIHFQ